MGLSQKDGKTFTFNSVDYSGLYAKVIKVPGWNEDKKIKMGIYASKAKADTQEGLITIIEKDLTDAEYETYFQITKAELIAMVNEYYDNDSDVINSRNLMKHMAYDAFLGLGTTEGFIPADWTQFV